jgi:hypothetical protein
LFLAVAALALGACGDDEGSNESATTGADATATTTGTTGTTTGATGTGTERTDKTTTRERKRDDKGGRRGGSDDSSGSGGGGNSGSSPEKQLTSKNVYSTSKTVCTDFLPIVLERDLKSGKKSAEDIAKDYANGYPSDERKRAYDGCLAGLKTKE